MFDHFLILKKLLGHFLEHMLFMETEKYPVENAYSAFLNDHGRFSNAYCIRKRILFTISMYRIIIWNVNWICFHYSLLVRY